MNLFLTRKWAWEPFLAPRKDMTWFIDFYALARDCFMIPTSFTTIRTKCSREAARPRFEERFIIVVGSDTYVRNMDFLISLGSEK